MDNVLNVLKDIYSITKEFAAKLINIAWHSTEILVFVNNVIMDMKSILMELAPLEIFLIVQILLVAQNGKETDVFNAQ
jgi:hypothetical protein